MLKSAKGCFLVVVAFWALQAVSAAGAVSSKVVEVITENYTLRFTNGQGVIVINNLPTLQIGTVDLRNWSPQFFKGVAAEKTGKNTVIVKYKTHREKPVKSSLSAKYTCLPNVIKIHYELSVPKEVKTGGAMFECSPLEGTAQGELFKGGLWTRNANGGESYEVKDGYFRDFINPNKKIMLKILGNADWAGPDYQHIPFSEVKGAANKHTFDKYTSDVEIFILPKKLSTAGAAAAVAGRDAVVEISTAKTYNLFDPKDGAPEFTVKVSNARSQALSGELTVIARTLDNKEVVDEKHTVSLGSLDTSQFRPKLPEAERELYFIDASLKVNGKEYFSRTNVAVIPDFEFKHKDESVFGISDYFELPDGASALNLLKRIGVHHLRDGDNELLSNYDILAFASISLQPEDEVTEKDLEKLLKSYVERDNSILEFGNEWNLLKPKWKDAKKYCRWAKRAFSIRANSLPIKIITQGIGGWDEPYLKYLMGKKCCNGWFEGVAFHPGRHNFTADADNDDLRDVKVGNWNYYGTVKNYMEFVHANGNIPAYATEVYAGTMPNKWWRDSYRQAASNIVLSLALGLAEGLSSIQIYQFNDGTRYDQGGIYQGNDDDERDQYHYGLLMRDLSLKPSAMAYAATAEILDGAKFVKYLNDHESNLRALVFDTDAGKASILWDRREGYVQRKHKVRHREPWLPTYKKKGTYKFTTNKDEVTVVDIIGRKHTVKAEDGAVELALDGEPIFVYDIEL